MVITVTKGLQYLLIRRELLLDVTYFRILHKLSSISGAHYYYGKPFNPLDLAYEPTKVPNKFSGITYSRYCRKTLSGTELSVAVLHTVYNIFWK